MSEMSEIRPGATVWLRCEVKPGPFSDERMIRVGPPENQWIGFVPARVLADQHVETGETLVRAQIVGVEEGYVSVRLPGHAIAASIFHSPIDQVTSLNDSL